MRVRFPSSPSPLFARTCVIRTDKQTRIFGALLPGCALLSALRCGCLPRLKVRRLLSVRRILRRLLIDLIGDLQVVAFGYPGRVADPVGCHVQRVCARQFRFPA